MEENKLKHPFVPLRDIVLFPGVTMYLELGREETKNAVLHAMQGERMIITSVQKNPETAHPGLDDMFLTGIEAKIKQVVKMPGEMLHAVVEGVRRVEVLYLETKENYVEASAVALPQEAEMPYSLEKTAMLRGLKELFRIYGSLNKKMNKKAVDEILSYTDLDRLIYEIMANIPTNYLNKQKIMMLDSVIERHHQLSVLLNQEIGIMRIQEDIALKVKGQVEENQKEFYLREELKAIYKELGQEDAATEADRYTERLEKLKAPKQVKKKLKEEIGRFKKINSNSSESAVIRGYIDTLLSFPWKKKRKGRMDIKAAKEVLDSRHYGLEKVKERILEYLAVQLLKNDGSSPVICLVGPPGTGKTSIAKSIAEALDRKYVRVCLGGVRDEAEIRGHRRTYIGAMPGRIAMGLKNAKVCNPVMLLDEIDKMGSDHKGDPASAMLEVLDTEQNKHFADHYVEIPIDLSKVMFICTANSTDTIPRPLLDRMEIIRLSGYTENEKLHIAKDYLYPKQLEKHGVATDVVSISDRVFTDIIRYYVKEAGVRNLERKIASVCRKAACEIALGENDKVRVSVRNEKKYLGVAPERINFANKEPEIGIVRGLAWTSAGGDTLEIQVNAVKGNGKLELTGKLGEVMQESAKIALSYVKTAQELKEEDFSEKDIHLHVPEGAVPKDGPSAGVTMATAMYSLFTEKKVRADVAMTGEITLRGQVLPVGGLKEKLLAAKAAGIETVFVPKDNEKDINELEEEITEGLCVNYAKHIEEIWKDVFV